MCNVGPGLLFSLHWVFSVLLVFAGAAFIALKLLFLLSCLPAECSRRLCEHEYKVPMSDPKKMRLHGFWIFICLQIWFKLFLARVLFFAEYFPHLSFLVYKSEPTFVVGCVHFSSRKHFSFLSWIPVTNLNIKLTQTLCQNYKCKIWPSYPGVFW